MKSRMAGGLFLCVWLGLALSLWADKTPAKYTANFYKAMFSEYEGKLVTISVVNLYPLNYTSEGMDGYSIFEANTFNREYGGYIHVAIPKDMVAKYIKKYGTSSYWSSNNARTKKLDGILTKFRFGMIGVVVAAEPNSGDSGNQTGSGSGTGGKTAAGTMKDVKVDEIEVDRTEALGKVVVMENVAFKVDTSKFSKTVGKRQKSAEGVFLMVKMTIKNKGEEMLNVRDNMFSIVDGNNATFAQTSAGVKELVYAKEEALSQKTLQSGQETSGWLIFDVPTRTQKYAVIVDDSHEKVRVDLAGAADAPPAGGR